MQMKLPVQKPEELLNTPTAVHRIPAYDLAKNLQIFMGKYLADPEPGFYHVSVTGTGQQHLAITKDTRLFKVVDEPQPGSLQVQPRLAPLSFQEFPLYRGDVYDATGLRLLERSEMERFKEVFSSQPNYPYVALQLVKRYINLKIAEFNPWASNSSAMAKVLELVRPSEKYFQKLAEHHHLTELYKAETDHALKEEIARQMLSPSECYHNCLEESLGHLSKMLDEVLAVFINELSQTPWHHYFVREFMGENLLVIRTCDYRVYEWNRREYELQNPEPSDD